MFVFVIDGYEEEYEKGEDANGHGGGQGFDPQHVVEGHLFRTGVVVVIVMMVVVMVIIVVSVAQTHFRQSQEHEDEQKRPANVFNAFLGRRHGYVGGHLFLRVYLLPMYYGNGMNTGWRVKVG